MRTRFSTETLAVLGMVVASVTISMTDGLGGQTMQSQLPTVPLIGAVSPALLKATHHGSMSPFPAQRIQEEKSLLSLEVVSWGPPMVDYLRQNTNMSDGFVLHAVESAIAASLQNGVDPALGVAGAMVDPALRTHAHKNTRPEEVVLAVNQSVRKLRTALDAADGDEIQASHRIGSKTDPLQMLRIRDRLLDIIETQSALPYRHKDAPRESQRRKPRP